MKEIFYPELSERCYEQTLENGLLVRVIPRPGFAKTLAFIAADFGSLDTSFELDGKKITVPDGIAHYLEHKMFDLPSGNAMDEFAAYGAGNNAFTNYAMTAYYCECTESVEENLEILLRMVTTPYFTDESVEKERGIIAQEIKMYEDSADSAVYENLFALMYPEHPIRVPIAGTVESIRDITPETLYACHKAFYDTANMMLCVMGDVDPQAICDFVKKHTPERSGVIAVRDSGAPEAKRGHAGRVEKRMEVSMPTFAIGFASEPVSPGREVLRQEAIGDLAAELLVGESSALYQTLYEKNLIDSDFSCGFEQIRGLGMLEFSGDSTDPDAVADAILAEAERIGREGFEQAAFDQILRAMLGRRLRALDSFDGVCYRTCAYRFDGAEYLDCAEVTREITPQDVREFLRAVVRRENMAISVIRPNKEA